MLPESEPDLLVLRPLGATDDEIAGILPALEPVSPATFDLPDPSKPGDARSAGCCATRSGSGSARAPARSAASARSRSSRARISSCRC